MSHNNSKSKRKSVQMDEERRVKSSSADSLLGKEGSTSKKDNKADPPNIRSEQRSRRRSGGRNVSRSGSRGRKRSQQRRGRSQNGSRYRSRSGSYSSQSHQDSYHRKHHPRNRRSNPRHPPNRKSFFSFQFYFSWRFIECLTVSCGKNLRDLQKDFNLDEIKITEKVKIPDLDGQVLTITDPNLEKKRKCTSYLLKQLVRFQNKENEEDDEKDTVKTVILVPESMVQFLIGKDGRMINRIQDDSGCKVNINQPIERIEFRTMRIIGTPKNASKAVEIAYQILDSHRGIKTRYNHSRIKPLRLSKATVLSKFLFPEKMVGYIIGKHGRFTKRLLDEFGVVMRFERAPRVNFLDYHKQNVCVMNGRMDNVQDGLCYVLRRVDEYFDFVKDKKPSIEDQYVYMVIPSSFVTKLIGQKGCMIRQIAGQSGGAQIKILSDKNTEHDLKECGVRIAGSLANKQDAACKILEYIEVFKCGGPVMSAGKHVDKEMVDQFQQALDREPYSARHRGKRRRRHHTPERNYSRGRRYRGRRSPSYETRRKRDRAREKYQKRQRYYSRSGSKSRGQYHRERKRSPSRHSRSQRRPRSPSRNRSPSKRSRPSRPRSPSRHRSPSHPRSQSHNSRPRESQRSYSKHNMIKEENKSPTKKQSRSRSRSQQARYKNFNNDKDKENMGGQGRRQRSRSYNRQRGSQRRSRSNRKKFSRESPPPRNRRNHSPHSDTHILNNQPLQERQQRPRTCHYIDKEGDARINISIIIPSVLIGHFMKSRAEKIQMIEKQTRTSISVSRDVFQRNLLFNNFKQTHPALKTYDGMPGQVVRITGKAEANGDAIKLFSEIIMQLEQEYQQKKNQQ